MLNIHGVWQEDEPDGYCSRCELPITDKKWVFFIQVGKVEEGDLTPANRQFCNKCYLEIIKDE